MDLHRALKIGALHVLERSDFDDASVVDEHVEPAEMGDDMANSFFYLAAILQITWENPNAPTAARVSSCARWSSAWSRASKMTRAPSAQS